MREVTKNNILLLGECGVDSIGKLLGLRVIRQFALHPNQIRIRSICNSTHDGALRSTLVSVVALTSPWSVPVKVHIDARQALGNGTSLCVTLALGLLVELVNQALLVHVHASVDGVGHSLVEELQTGLGSPRILNGLESRSVLASLLSCIHEVSEWLESRVGGSKHVRVIAMIDSRCDESGRFRIRSSHSEEIDAHDVCLSTNGHEPVNVLTHGDENLASHVSALLGTRHLILNVNTSCTLLHEELGELHHSSQTTVSGVSISDNGSEVIDVVELRSLARWGAEALFALLAVVEQLSHEQVVHLVGNSGIWVICKIWTGLV